MSFGLKWTKTDAYQSPFNVVDRPCGHLADSYNSIWPGFKSTEWRAPSWPSISMGHGSSSLSYEWSTWTMAEMMCVSTRSVWNPSDAPRWYARMP